ncbi:MAG: penicillin acylase family protein [Chloroflexi bacterium]|nr:penicillin acylase family protein [Chloroflexota bacterium]
MLTLRALTRPLLLALGFVAGAGVAYLGARKLTARRRSSERVVVGIGGPVEIVRDRWWTPHILAGSLEDALFGQGYVHAEDRLFQMDLVRRVAAGRLSELFGERTLEVDRFFRVLGLWPVAEEEWQRTPPRERRFLEAYSAGVNAAQARLRPPLEAQLLRYRIEPWDPVATLAVARVLSTSLTTNWESELARWQLAHRVGGGRVWANEVEPLRPDIRWFMPEAGLSNAWALAGSRTATGKPLLAGDPHLRAAFPPSLHLSHLRGGEVDVIGATMAGIPGILMGHNQRIAWSVTAALTDTADLFLEEFDAAGRYRRGTDWHEPRVRLETIRVRGRPPVVQRVVTTDRGPLVSSVLDPGLPAFSLATTVLTREPHTVAVLTELLRAHDWSSFRQALRHWSYPPLNFVYADVDGHIGWQLAGFHPRRAAGDGVLPQPAAEVPGWQGWVPFDELPCQLDPPEGQIVSANEPPSGGPFLGFDMFERSRADRAHELLRRSNRHTVDSLRRIQADWYSIPLHRFARALLAAQPRRASEARALDLLQEWDGRLLPGSAAAAVVEVALRRLLDEHATREFGELAPLWLGIGPHPAAPYNSYAYRNRTILLRLVEEWQADGSWPERATTLLAGTVEELQERLGEPAAWAWGKLHTLTVRHPLGVGPLGRVLNRGPFQLGGDFSTIFQTALDPTVRYEAAAATPAVRQIYDLADWDRSRVVLPGGQSGSPLSRHYADQLPDWLAVRDHPLPYSEAAVAASAAQRLRLVPREGSSAVH